MYAAFGASKAASSFGLFVVHARRLARQGRVRERARGGPVAAQHAPRHADEDRDRPGVAQREARSVSGHLRHQEQAGSVPQPEHEEPLPPPSSEGIVQSGFPEGADLPANREALLELVCGVVGVQELLRLGAGYFLKVVLHGGDGVMMIGALSDLDKTIAEGSSVQALLVERIKSAFEQMDKDGDGKLSLVELLQFLETTNQRYAGVSEVHKLKGQQRRQM
eukprot:CAMPEP_0179076666 /NCGR_PEP_ID=MMETSP0796-20121207/34218_1 /TAXON_ID=73915 /ORGANISM="Pyrodinium bahamense, Strain pbaha01" /LENGTH=220 /DNA_ID=CAMNT_0020773925 /DNA_START=337 /DNA_END=1001 /DNA_ORIENTATION=+